MEKKFLFLLGLKWNMWSFTPFQAKSTDIIPDLLKMPDALVKGQEKVDEKEWDEMCKTLNIEFVPTVIIVDDKLDTAKLLTPDIHFDEIQECFDQILEAVR